MNIEPTLELLVKELPDPFQISNTDSLTNFFNHPIIKKLNKTPNQTTNSLLKFLNNKQQHTNLIRIAVLLLSQYNPSIFYENLLSLISQSNQNYIEASELGIWHINLPKEKIANDLIHIVTADNPYPLLLLQRPIAVSIKNELKVLINNKKIPHNLYALYAYKYTLSKNDEAFLKDITKCKAYSAISGLAGVYLLSIGSKAGLKAIKLGLMSSDLDTRKLIYYELYPFINDSVRIKAKYDYNVLEQPKAIQLLIKEL